MRKQIVICDKMVKFVLISLLRDTMNNRP